LIFLLHCLIPLVSILLVSQHWGRSLERSLVDRELLCYLHWIQGWRFIWPYHFSVPHVKKDALCSHPLAPYYQIMMAQVRDQHWDL
jgi:hypothetical protein